MSAVPKWLDERRAEADGRFRELGVPHRRIEDWKYTDLRSVLDDVGLSQDNSPGGGVRNALAQGVEQYDFDNDEPPRWVKENFGKVGPRSAMAEAALANAEHLIGIRVPSGVVAHIPLEMELIGTGSVRVLIVVEEGGAATLLEIPVVGSDSQLVNAGLEIVLNDGAVFEHVRVGQHLATAVIVESISISVASGAKYRGHFTNFGAKLSRVDMNITLNGDGAQAHLTGVDVLAGVMHADVTTHVDHVIGNTQSTQLFKKVAGGKARSIYQGKVTVRPGANGSDSRQTAKGLLLSDHAEIDLKPELEILADDVKCAHGAAVGDLDTDSLFYLRARGIPEAEARNMLVHAFLADALEGIENETVRTEVWARVERALVQAGAA